MSDEKPNVIFQIANVGPGGIVAHTIENLNVSIHNAGIDDTLKVYYLRLARECQLTTLNVIESDALDSVVTRYAAKARGIEFAQPRGTTTTVWRSA